MPVCSACHHDNPGEARFCNQCGNALTQTVADSPSPRSYTPKHLAERILRQAATLRGERKQVTVLFADVKGSTQLAHQAGAERWHDVLDRLFAILTEAVHRYGGTVNQYTGDGIMALFGAPIAHEDHAQRAAHAALAIRTAVREYADRLRLDEGLNLSLRTGMNSGEVVVGAIGDDLRMDYTAQGHTVNLAARMESIAEPGRVYLTRHTAGLIEGYFHLRDLGETTVSGLEEPLRVYELEDVGAIATRLELSRRRGLSRFVGRGPELEQLETALREVSASGSGRVVAVSGNAGIGKSRLCHEFAERCRAHGLEIHMTHAVAYGEAIPYWPVQQLLRSVFGIVESDSADAARRKIAGALLLGDESARESLGLIFNFLGLDTSEQTGEGGVDLSPDERMQRLHALSAKALAECEEPVLLVIEDAHWLDAGSVAFFSVLIEALPRAPALLVFNHRSDYVLEWLWHAADIEIPLHALDEQALGALLHERLGEDPSLGDLVRRITAQAAGNPYFVEEAVLDLAERGLLAGEPGAYRLVETPARLEIPDTVQAILTARIDRLPSREKDLLQAAAVIGKEFPAAWLPGVAGVDEGQATAALEALAEAGFVHAADLAAQDYAFCHPLMQEVAYDSQLGDTRRARHAQLAETIEAQIPEPQQPGESAILLAYHWRLANQPRRAGVWALRAGVWLSQRDIRASLNHFRAAVEQLPADTEDAAYSHDAIAARAAVVRIAGLVQVPDAEVEQAYTQARQLLQRVDDPSAEAELTLSYAMRELLGGDAGQSLAKTRQALEIAAHADDPNLLARFRMPVLNNFFMAGRLREGLQALAGSGTDEWARAPITEDNLGSRGLRAMMIGLLGDLNEARDESLKVLEVAEAHGRRLSWLYSNLVEFAWLAGESERTLDWAQKAMDWSDAYGSAMFSGMAHRALAVACMLHGDTEQALSILRDTEKQLTAGTPGYQFASVHYELLAEVERRRGNRESARRYADSAVELGKDTGMTIWELRARLTMARILLESGGERGQLAAQLDRAEVLVAHTGADVYAPMLVELRAEQLWLGGDREAAVAYFKRAQQLYDQIGAPRRARAAGQRISAIDQGVKV